MPRRSLFADNSLEAQIRLNLLLEEKEDQYSPMDKIWIDVCAFCNVCE